MHPFCLTLLAALGLACVNSDARAQGYPTRRSTMITPFPAGGAIDLVARVLGERMRPFLSQPLVVENVTGASGSIGIGRVARAPPTATRSASAAGPRTSSTVRSSPPVRCAERFRAGLAARNAATAHHRQAGHAGEGPEGIDRLAEGKPGQGIAGHCRPRQPSACRRRLLPKDRHALSVRALSRRHPAMQRTGGRTDRYDDRPGGQLSAAGPRRHRQGLCRDRQEPLAAAPDIPTVDEAGLPGFYFGLACAFCPQGTPKTVIAKLNAAVVEALADPAVRAAVRRSRPGAFPARAADAGSARRLSQGRDREVVADHQGSRHQGGINACAGTIHAHMIRCALIIGGSLGGLFAGAMLRSIGWDVMVFECAQGDLSRARHRPREPRGIVRDAATHLDFNQDCRLSRSTSTSISFVNRLCELPSIIRLE